MTRPVGVDPWPYRHNAVVQENAERRGTGSRNGSTRRPSVANNEGVSRERSLPKWSSERIGVSFARPRLTVYNPGIDSRLSYCYGERLPDLGHDTREIQRRGDEKRG